MPNSGHQSTRVTEHLRSMRGIALDAFIHTRNRSPASARAGARCVGRQSHRRARRWASRPGKLKRSRCIPRRSGLGGAALEPFGQPALLCALLRSRKRRARGCRFRSSRYIGTAIMVWDNAVAAVSGTRPPRKCRAPRNRGSCPCVSTLTMPVRREQHRSATGISNATPNAKNSSSTKSR